MRNPRLPQAGYPDMIIGQTIRRESSSLISGGVQSSQNGIGGPSKKDEINEENDTDKGRTRLGDSRNKDLDLGVDMDELSRDGIEYAKNSHKYIEFGLKNQPAGRVSRRITAQRRTSSASSDGSSEDSALSNISEPPRPIASFLPNLFNRVGSVFDSGVRSLSILTGDKPTSDKDTSVGSEDPREVPEIHDTVESVSSSPTNSIPLRSHSSSRELEIGDTVWSDGVVLTALESIPDRYPESVGLEGSVPESLHESVHKSVQELSESESGDESESDLGAFRTPPKPVRQGGDPDDNFSTPPGDLQWNQVNTALINIVNNEQEPSRQTALPPESAKPPMKGLATKKLFTKDEDLLIAAAYRLNEREKHSPRAFVSEQLAKLLPHTAQSIHKRFIREMKSGQIYKDEDLDKYESQLPEDFEETLSGHPRPNPRFSFLPEDDKMLLEYVALKYYYDSKKAINYKDLEKAHPRHKADAYKQRYARFCSHPIDLNKYCINGLNESQDIIPIDWLKQDRKLLHSTERGSPVLPNREVVLRLRTARLKELEASGMPIPAAKTYDVQASLEEPEVEDMEGSDLDMFQDNFSPNVNEPSPEEHYSLSPFQPPVSYSTPKTKKNIFTEDQTTGQTGLEETDTFDTRSPKKAKPEDSGCPDKFKGKAGPNEILDMAKATQSADLLNYSNSLISDISQFLIGEYLPKYTKQKVSLGRLAALVRASNFDCVNIFRALHDDIASPTYDSSKKFKANIPTDMRGIWTDEDDDELFTNQQRLEKKHGSQGIQLRKAVLNYENTFEP